MAFLTNGINDKNVKSLYSIKTYPQNQAEFIINVDSFDSPVLSVSLNVVNVNFDSDKLNDKPIMVFAQSINSTLDAWDGSLDHVRINFRNGCSFMMNIIFIEFKCYMYIDDSGYILASVENRSGVGDVAPNGVANNFNLWFMLKGVPYASHNFCLNTVMVFSVV